MCWNEIQLPTSFVQQGLSHNITTMITRVKHRVSGFFYSPGCFCSSHRTNVTQRCLDALFVSTVQYPRHLRGNGVREWGQCHWPNGLEGFILPETSPNVVAPSFVWVPSSFFRQIKVPAEPYLFRFSSSLIFSPGTLFHMGLNYALSHLCHHLLQFYS